MTVALAAGERYGRWTVLRSRRWAEPTVVVRCDCGTERSASVYALRAGRSRSGGCARLPGDCVPPFRRSSPPRRFSLPIEFSHALECPVATLGQQLARFKCVDGHRPAIPADSLTELAQRVLRVQPRAPGVPPFSIERLRQRGRVPASGVRAAPSSTSLSSLRRAAPPRSLPASARARGAAWPRPCSAG